MGITLEKFTRKAKTKPSFQMVKINYWNFEFEKVIHCSFQWLK